MIEKDGSDGGTGHGDAVLVFVHGLANGPEDRAEMYARIGGRLATSRAKDTFAALSIAQWRSRGSWTADVADLCHPDGIRAAEAVTDVLRVVTKVADFKIVLCGHSMGAVFARLAVGRMRHLRCALVTVGSPLGNPVLSAGLYAQTWAQPALSPCPVIWTDVWNREDPICADPLLGHVVPMGVGKSVQVTAPGHPTVMNALGEHGAYFDLDHFWTTVKAAAEAIS